MTTTDRAEAEAGDGFAGDRPFLARAERRARLLASRRIPFVLDVGACRGEYAQALRDAGYLGRIASFEPLAASYRELYAASASDPAWDAHQTALGSTSGTADLNVAHDARCSSLLMVGPRSIAAAPESAFIDTARVEVRRLDDLWSSLVPAGMRPYLKLDVQGFELEVLNGLGACFDLVAALEVELSLTPLYHGGALWSEVVDFLDIRGFRLASVEPVFEDVETGEMLQIDGIFVRDARPARSV
ncbi:FkbM family methyltransferase [Streptomyces sp. NPDC052494]|uniref:FkbM family methyltransferase n=1 Tax=Streptomyces sp. NPDC052494 TaxID=3365692 RepID=UPI0037D9221B